MHAFLARSFARRMFSETSETRAGAFIFSRRRPRARAFHFLKPFFDFVSFVSVEHTHPATMMDFIQIETRSSFAHRRVVTLQNQQIGLGLGSGRGLGLGLAWIHFFLHFGARVIHPSIHRASCVEGGTATATATAMPPVMPRRRRRRRRNGGGGTFRDGEDDGAGGVTRRTNA